VSFSFFFWPVTAAENVISCPFSAWVVLVDSVTSSTFPVRAVITSGLPGSSLNTSVAFVSPFFFGSSGRRKCTELSLPTQRIASVSGGRYM